MRFLRGLIAVVVLWGASAAWAQPQVQVEVGWGNHYRPGAWTPLFLTVSDPVNRQVVLEITSPHSGPFALDIRQGFAIGPIPATYAIYVPLPQQYQLSEVTLKLTDARSGRKLMEDVLADPFSNSMSQGLLAQPPVELHASFMFVGTSGQQSTARLLGAQWRTPEIQSDYLPPRRLPVTAMGYDGIDLLILGAFDFGSIDADQQQALLDWVRAGGRLLLWPSEDAVPKDGALIDALPCRIGENRTYDIPPAKLKAAGLPERFAKLKGRQLAPATTAEEIKLFGGDGPDGFRERVGLGEIVVLPIDASVLQFESGDPNVYKAADFWRETLAGFAELPKHDPENPNARYQQYGQGDHRRAAAVSRAIEWLGDIPGAGAFGFGYVASILIAMMVIVGPVDWFILKRLGRQPWTWFTTAGWIALVTLGAIYIGHVFKSGDLHFRTLRLIDQSGDARVADTTLLGIYSPRTTDYHPEFTPDSWWEPANENVYNYRSGGILNEIPVRQDYRGTRPVGMRINVWNLRFLEGETIAAGPPVVRTRLAVTPPAGGKPGRLTGTITNAGPSPLTNVIVRTADGIAGVDKLTIAPGATAEIDAAIDPTDRRFSVQTPQQPNYYPYYNQRPVAEGARVDPPQYAALSDLVADRSDRIAELLKRRGVACVYADMVDPAPPAELGAAGAIEAHRATLRAVVAVEEKP